MFAPVCKVVEKQLIDGDLVQSQLKHNLFLKPEIFFYYFDVFFFC